MNTLGDKFKLKLHNDNILMLSIKHGLALLLRKTTSGGATIRTTEFLKTP